MDLTAMPRWSILVIMVAVGVRDEMNDRRKAPAWHCGELLRLRISYLYEEFLQKALDVNRGALSIMIFVFSGF